MSSLSQTGKFIDFYLPYSHEHGPVSAVQQAESILKLGREFWQARLQKTAILYSANYGQTRKIQQVYLANGWETHISGSNQATVMHTMESLLHQPQYKNLRTAVRILPITTMNAYQHPVIPWNENILFGIVQTDLDRVRAYLKSGWIVLGWQNQNTVNTQFPYAIGGGISRLPPSVSIYIQTRLKEFAEQFC